MTDVEAEFSSLEIANRVDDLVASLPGDTSAAARQALTDARNALRKAADAFSDEAERQK